MWLDWEPVGSAAWPDRIDRNRAGWIARSGTENRLTARWTQPPTRQNRRSNHPPTDACMANFGFPPELRIRKRAEFDRVFAARISVADENLIIHAACNELGHTRLGLAVSRRVGGAVQRNRWKRRLREAFRLAQAKLPPGIDLVAIPRRQAPPTMPVIQQSLLQLVRRAHRKLHGRQ